MIAILGGGIAGASLALALAARGRRGVVVFDPGRMGGGSTGRALGGFRTQHRSALGVALALASRPFFERHGDRVGFRSCGYLYLADDEASARELAERAALQRELGLPITHPDPLTLAPFLEVGDVTATNFCALDGVCWPPEVLRAVVEDARSAGVDFRYGQAATEREIESADAVVIAAGTWSPVVGRRLGVELRVESVERAVFQAGPFDFVGPGVPVTLEARSGYHFRARAGRLLVMGPGDQHRWGHFRSWLERRAPAAAAELPEAAWSGLYEVSFDGHALVGATERDRTWAMCGFSGHGVMQSPAVAESLAAMILGRSPAIDLAQLSPLRRVALRDDTQL